MKNVLYGKRIALVLLSFLIFSCNTETDQDGSLGINYDDGQVRPPNFRGLNIPDNIIQNASFENNNIIESVGAFERFEIPNWTRDPERGNAFTVFKGISLENISPVSGLSKIALSGAENASISQVVNLVVGEKYHLFFDYVPRSVGTSVESLKVFIGDEEVANINSTGNKVWKSHHYTFVANSESAKLSFVGGGNRGVFLDNLKLYNWSYELSSNLVINGDFLNNINVTSNSFTDFMSIDGWAPKERYIIPAIEASYGKINTLAASDGFIKIELESTDGNASIFQEVVTEVDEEYTFKIDFERSSLSAEKSNDIKFLLNDREISTLTKATNTKEWSTYTYTFTANESLTRLELRGIGVPDGNGGLLDNAFFGKTSNMVNLLVNHSFEQGSGLLPLRGKYTNRLEKLVGWNLRETVKQTPLRILNGRRSGGISPVSGENKLKLDGQNNTSVVQMVPTSGTKLYLVSFYYAPESINSIDTNGAEIYWNNELRVKVSSDERIWKEYSFIAQGSNSSSELMFKATGKSDNLGALIDKVTVREIDGINNTPPTISSEQTYIIEPNEIFNFDLEQAIDLEADIIQSYHITSIRNDIGVNFTDCISNDALDLSCKIDPQGNTGFFSFKYRAFDGAVYSPEKEMKFQIADASDIIGPVIDLVSEQTTRTSDPIYTLKFNIIDGSSTLTTIDIMGAEGSITTESKSFSQNIVLTEGENIITITSTDARGNIEQNSRVLNLTLDTTGPVLSIDQTGTLRSANITFTGSANEELISISVNDIDGDVTSTNFSNEYTFMSEGEHSVVFTARDTLGNTSTQTIDFKVKEHILNMNLISINPIAGKLLVVGRAGAVDSGLTVNISTGIFSGEDVIAAEDGSFSIEMDNFSTADISVYSPAFDFTESGVLSHEVDTTFAGVVKDVNGAALPGVTVTIPSSGQTAITDISGTFTIDNPTTGDHRVSINGSTVSPTYSSDKKFSETFINVSIGHLQQNILKRDIYLTPKMVDGTETEIVQDEAASVTSVHAPGVVLSIPANVVRFPGDALEGSINIMEIDANKSSVALPRGLKPETIVALEPSGTTFEERVSITLPNDNDLPDGTEMVILSKNSTTGKWEVDGGAIVEGGSVVSKEGMGISHFSEVFAVPFGMEMKKFGPKDRPGISNDSGAVSSTIELPSFKVMGQNITPSLNYKSTWANPLATITNVFDIPQNKVELKDSSTSGSLLGVGKSSTRIKSWIEPEYIESQFFAGSVVSEKVRFIGVPNKSVVSYSMDLGHLASGVYPARSTYELQLKRLTVGSTKVKTYSFGQVKTEIKDIDEVDLLEKIFPEDLTTNIYHNNKSNSEFGAGWHLSGALKILNPNNNRLALESSDGSVQAYTLENTVETIISDDDGINGFTVSSNDILTYSDSLGQIKVNDIEDSLGEDSSILLSTANYVGKVGAHTAVMERKGEYCCRSGVFGCEKKCNDYRYKCETRQYEHDITKKIISFIQYGSQKYLALDSNGAIFNINNGESLVAGLNTSISEIFKISQSGSISIDNECDNRISNQCENPTNYNTRTFTRDKYRVYDFNRCGLATKNSEGNFPKKGYTNGILTSTSFNNPKDIIEGSSPNIIYVADYGNNLIRKIDTDSGISQNFAGNRQTFDSGDGGQATDASLYHPTGLVKDSIGNIYVSTERGYIRKISPSGIITKYAGLPEGSPNAVFADTTDKNNVSLLAPSGMAIDEENGYIYVADSGHHRILQISLLDNKARTVAGTTSCSGGTSYDGKSALNTSICTPKKIGLDKNKNLLFLDNDGNRVRRVVLNNEASGVKRFASTNNDNSKIAQLEDKSYELVTRDGIRSLFSTTGLLEQVIDKLGNTTNFSYIDGLITEVEYSTGQKLLIDYVGGRISSIEDPAGRVTSFIHNGNILDQVTYPDNSTQTFVYNENSMLESVTNKNSEQIFYEYDTLGRYKKTLLPTGDEISTDSLISGTIANGAEESNPKELNSLEDEENPLVDIYTDARNVSTIMKKDESGFIETIVDSKDRESFVERDVEGRPTKITKFNSEYIEFSYNELGDLVFKKDSETNKTEFFSYDNYGGLISYTNPEGRTKNNFYDDVGLLVQEVDFQGNSVFRSYFDNGLVETMSNDLGEITSFGYDLLGNLSLKESPEGEVVTYTRDLAGNIIEKENDKGIRTLYSYDMFNRLTSVASGVTLSDPIGRLTTYTYTLSGQLEKIIDPQGNETLFEYDVLDRMIKKTTPLGQVTELAYDGGGNVVWKKDPNGNIKSYEYDSENLLTKKTLPDNSYVMSYDDEGNMTSIVDSDSSIAFTYKKVAGEFFVESTTTNGTNIPSSTISYNYNASGSRTNMTTSYGTFTYAYDLNERLISVNNHKSEVFTMSYDASNRLRAVHKPSVKSTFNYDANGFLSGLQHEKNSGGLIDQLSYTRDVLGNRTSILSSRGLRSYTYDSESQVKTSSNSELSASYSNETFNYDSLGNRTNDQLGNYSYDNKSQRLTEDYNHFYLYDNNGNMVSIQNKGLTGSLKNLTYSSENQLIQVEEFLNSVKVKTMSYIYDALGRRTQKQIIDHVDANNSFERKYLYDGQEILAELDEDDTTLGVFTHSTLRTDDVLAVDVKDTKLANSIGTFFYLKDALGSITDVVSSSGTLVQHYAYSSFGKVVKISDSAGSDVTTNPIVKTSFGYTNRELDVETGMMYYRARFYSPEIGRFISSDPHPGKKSEPMTVNNRYIYALNNPLLYTDPSGEFVFTGIAIAASYFLSTAALSTAATIALTAVATAAFTGAGYEIAAGYDSGKLGDVYSSSAFWNSVGLSFVGGLAGGAVLSGTGLLSSGMFSNGARLAVNSSSGAFGAGALFGAVNATTQLGVLAATGADVSLSDAALIIGVSSLAGGLSFGVQHIVNPNYVSFPLLSIGTGEAYIYQQYPID